MNAIIALFTIFAVANAGLIAAPVQPVAVVHSAPLITKTVVPAPTIVHAAPLVHHVPVVKTVVPAAVSYSHSYRAPATKVVYAHHPVIAAAPIVHAPVLAKTVISPVVAPAPVLIH